MTTSNQQPKLSIILPVFRPDMAFFHEAIASVVGQDYRNWELCIHDDGSHSAMLDEYLSSLSISDTRVLISQSESNAGIAEASNLAAQLATGDYILLLDQDDLLASGALTQVARKIEGNPSASLIYSDEDKLDGKGNRVDPNFKPDFNHLLLLGQNYICHLLTIKKTLFEQVGGFRSGFDGAQDHDLILRLIEAIDVDEIVHIPQILYHWRMHESSTAQDLTAKPAALEAGRRAVAEHLERTTTNAKVSITGIRYRVEYQLDESPSVTVVIPTRNQLHHLTRCIDSLLKQTDYPNYSVLVIDNGSDDWETLQYLRTLSKSGVEVLVANEPFNFSKLNNRAVSKSKSDYLCLLNNDTEVISPNWLHELVSHAEQEQVGCVGAKLLYPNDSIQHAGVILGIGGVAGHAHKDFPRDSDGYLGRLTVSQHYSAVTAACLLVRKTIWEQVGGFEESLAVAFNDVDFCLKVRKQGYHVVWTPWAELYHHESVSRGAETTPENQERFSQEVAYMRTRWGDLLTSDPFYNPNLTLEAEDFSIPNLRK